MSKHANPTTIGAFVVGAIILVASAFALFGGSQIFKEKYRYIAIFDEPTNGLRVGANVLLNGVRVGYVSDIDLLIDEVNFGTDTLVILELLPEDIKTRSGQKLGGDSATFLDHDTLINDAGLRAALEIESFVTGLLRVELQLRPDTPAVMRTVNPQYPEIPTITSNIQELLNKVKVWFTDVRENMDIGGLSHRLNNALQAIEGLAGSEDLHQTLAGINRLVNDDEIRQLSSKMNAALDELRLASTAARDLIRDANDSVDILADDLKPVLDQLAAVLDQSEQAISAAKLQLKGDSQQLYQLRATLEELERASRSVREFFDYLERNPESLLRGKPE